MSTRIEIIDEVKASGIAESLYSHSILEYAQAFLLSDMGRIDMVPSIRIVNQLIANAIGTLAPYLIIDQTDPRISISGNILTFTPDVAFQTSFGTTQVRMRALISNGTGTDDATLIASENYSYSSPGVVATVYLTDFYATTFKLIFTL